MTVKSRRVVLGSEAEKDFIRILAFNREGFGPRQEVIYETTILKALAELDSGPEVARSIARDDLRPAVRSLHVARQGRRGRHVIFYRVTNTDLIQVVRILHDATDFAQHVSTDGD